MARKCPVMSKQFLFVINLFRPIHVAMAITSLGTAGAFVARDVCTHLFVAYDTPARRRSSSYKPPSPSAPPAPKYSGSGRGRFKPFATGEANPLFENAYNKAMQVGKIVSARASRAHFSHASIANVPVNLLLFSS